MRTSYGNVHFTAISSTSVLNVDFLLLHIFTTTSSESPAAPSELLSSSVCAIHGKIISGESCDFIILYTSFAMKMKNTRERKTTTQWRLRNGKCFLCNLYEIRLALMRTSNNKLLLVGNNNNHIHFVVVLYCTQEMRIIVVMHYLCEIKCEKLYGTLQ